MNRYKQENKSKTQSSQKNKAAKGFALVAGWLSKEQLMKNLPYICFISLLAIGYIWNVHRAERMAREIEDLNSELKKMRWKYMTTQAELMNISKQSKMTELVDEMKLEALKVPPKKITIDEEMKKEE